MGERGSTAFVVNLVLQGFTPLPDQVVLQYPINHYRIPELQLADPRLKYLLVKRIGKLPVIGQPPRYRDQRRIPV
jgi:hypothetical protein